MAEFAQLADGSLDDRVRILFGGTELHTFVNYEVKSGIIAQPSAFSVRLGQSASFAELQKRIPPNTPFELRIGNVPQFTGFTDGFRNSGGSNGGSLELRGRDPIGRLFDAQVEFETSFVDVTYAGLVQKAMTAVGLSKDDLVFDNKDQRVIKAGIKVQTISEPAVGAEVTQQADGDHVRHVVHAKTGESWLDFVYRHIERAGLFLFAGPGGKLVLGRPNGKQKAAYHFIRQRGQPRNVVNVIEHDYTFDTLHRFSEALVYARIGGKKYGRGIVKGNFVDEEMSGAPPAGLGFKRKRVFRDVNVQNAAQAELYARRKIAEANRASVSLVYTCKGHTAPAISGGGRAVLVPDTVARVDDDENGLARDFYIENVTYHGGEATTSTVQMMRTEDLVFGKDD